MARAARDRGGLGAGRAPLPLINEDREDPGGALPTVFVDDLDKVVEEIAGRGIEPAEWETYSNGVRKAIYRDADGNEVGFGGPSA